METFLYDGRFMGYFLINSLHLNFFLALILAMIGTAALGVLVEFLAYRPLEKFDSDCSFDYCDWCFIFLGICDGLFCGGQYSFVPTSD